MDVVMSLVEPYATRSVRCLDLLAFDGLRLKLYGIAYRGERPVRPLVDAAVAAARKRLPRPAVTNDTIVRFPPSTTSPVEGLGACEVALLYYGAMIRPTEHLRPRPLGISGPQGRDCSQTGTAILPSARPIAVPVSLERQQELLHLEAIRGLPADEAANPSHVYARILRNAVAAPSRA
jgi:hypothetical protein